MIGLRSPLLALFGAFFEKKGAARARLDELCEYAPLEGPDEDLVFWFVQLVDWLRPRDGQRIEAKLKFLEVQLAQHSEWRPRLARALARLIEHVEMDRLLAYGGIPLEFHLGGAMKEWMLVRALPSACKTRDGAQVLRLAFQERDLAWLGDEKVAAFFRPFVEEALAAPLEAALRDALTDLAHQIVAQAHAPSVRALAQGERSPYRGLYDAVVALEAAPRDSAAFGGVRGRIEQCVLRLRSHRDELVDRGADLNTTFQLRRLREQLDRLGLLARLRHDPRDATLAATLSALTTGVVHDARRTRLITRSADLLVENVVDTAATVGRAYLDEEQSSWRAAFLAGAGGGALMAVATVVKFMLHGLHLPTLYEGVAFSLNYASVFVAAYLLHYTIATKLPAHTAAALARSSQNGASHRARLQAFMSVWSSALRLQLAGLLGNVVVVGPLAFLFDVAARRALGHHIVSAETAEHVLSAQSILGPSAIFAALTGVFLWISSIVGALGDNWARVTQLSDRLATNVHVMRRLGAAHARHYADALVKRVGGLLGNATLGVLLGAVPAAFAIAHIPVEIRHITVSTGSVALALATGVGSRADVILASSGLVAIAIVNVGVSFLLAFWLALRATRGTRTSASSHALVRIGIRRWTRRHHGFVPDPIHADAPAATADTPTIPASRKAKADRRAAPESIV